MAASSILSKKGDAIFCSGRSYYRYGHLCLCTAIRHRNCPFECFFNSSTGSRTFMTIDQIATNLVDVAVRCGVRKGEHVRLKSLVEGLAVQDAKLPPEQRRGFDHVYKTYTPQGYGRLFSRCDKIWPEPVKKYPEPIPSVPGTSSPCTTYSCVVELPSTPPISFRKLVELNSPEFSLNSIKKVHQISERLFEILLIQWGRLDESIAAIQKLNPISFLLRQPQDFGKPFFDLTKLDVIDAKLAAHSGNS